MLKTTMRNSMLVVLSMVALVGCPRQPAVVVSDTSHHFDVILPDSYETAWSFEVWNGGARGTTLVFDVSASKPWIHVEPATGQSTGASDKVTVNVTIDRDYSALVKAAPAFLGGVINVTSDVNNASVAITTAPDYFTQEFAGGLGGIAGKTFTFRPNGSLSYYGATQEDATEFPGDPAGGALLDFSIADPVEVKPWYGANVRLYGVPYETFFVGSGGFISFGEDAAKAKAAATLPEHFATPQITGLSSVDATLGGSVVVSQTADKVVVTYEDVPSAAKQGGNSFQVEMFLNGQIRVTYLGLDADDGIVGLSFGPDVGQDGLPPDFLQSDFPGYNTPGLGAKAQ